MDTAAADQLVLDLMRQLWAEMAQGETQTVWEGLGRGEYCHNWGSAPTYFLSRRVLGVRVDDPGVAIGGLSSSRVWETSVGLKGRWSLNSVPCRCGGRKPTTERSLHSKCRFPRT